jgi:hypothetical protein
VKLIKETAVSKLKFLILGWLFCSGLAHATAIDSDKVSINVSCKKDAATAGCPLATMGKGLGKCLFKYKNMHPKYEATPGCKSAMIKFKQDLKAAAAKPKSK